MPRANSFLNQLTATDVVALLLGARTLRVGQGQITSLIVALLDDARMIGGRTNTGIPRTGAHLSCWMACLGYLIFLEQVGKCFQIKNWKRKRGETDIETALRMHTDLTKGQRAAVFALRCALAHGYNLSNPNHRQETKNQRFILTENANNPLLKLRTRKWDGKPANRNKRTFTTLNIIKLENLCEEIYRDLIAAHNAQNLRLRTRLKPKDAFLTYMMHSH